MEDFITLGLTREEAVTMSEELERMVAVMRKAHEQMALDQIEIDRLKAESSVLLADLERKLGGNDAERIL